MGASPSSPEPPPSPPPSPMPSNYPSAQSISQQTEQTSVQYSTQQQPTEQTTNNDVKHGLERPNVVIPIIENTTESSQQTNDGTTDSGYQTQLGNVGNVNLSLQYHTYGLGR